MFFKAFVSQLKQQPRSYLTLRPFYGHTISPYVRLYMVFDKVGIFYWYHMTVYKSTIRSKTAAQSRLFNFLFRFPDEIYEGKRFIWVVFRWSKIEKKKNARKGQLHNFNVIFAHQPYRTAGRTRKGVKPLFCSLNFIML